MKVKTTPFARPVALSRWKGTASKAFGLILILTTLSYSALAFPFSGQDSYFSEFAKLIGIGGDKDPIFTAELSESPQFTQGFEVNDVWGSPATDPNRVASGTNGVTSRTGGFHAEVQAGDFTRWGGYSGTFPSMGYTTSIDMYLNTAGGYANDTRLNFSSAVSDTSAGFRRDFIFHVGFYNDGGPVGTGNRFAVTASNNSPGNPRDPGRTPIAIPTSGWYTFKHRFYNAGGGVLAVEMKVINSSNITLGTWTLSDPSDIIGSTVGGNRYGWFVTNSFPSLAIDNSVRSNIVPPGSVKVSDLNPQGWAFFNEGATGSGSFVTGPATPPVGTGSVNLTVDSTGRHAIGKIYQNIRFDQITELGYSTYQASANPAVAISMQFQLDYDLTDANQAFQGRLTYEPYHTETVQQNTWQTWTPLTGKWWASGAPGNTVCPQATPCTWAQVLAAFPNAGIHASPTLGAVIFRAGGPVNFPFTGNVDNFTFGVNNTDTVTDFEAANPLMVDDDGLGSPGNCDGTDAVSTTIAGSVAAAAPGSTIQICSGTYSMPSTLALNKANMTLIGLGATKPVIQVPQTASPGMLVTADGVTLDNLEIQKTDLGASPHHLVQVQANGFTAQNNLMYGPDPGGTWSSTGYVSRAFSITPGRTGLLLTNNVIHTLRQPAYLDPNVTGTVSNNRVSGTKGWVVDGAVVNFTGNLWGEPQNQDCDIALLPSVNPASYPTRLAMSQANDNAFICAQYATGENGRATAYVDDGAAANGNGSDNTNYQTITAGIAGALTGGTVSVAGGTYNEDVAVGKTVKVQGAGPVGTTVVGPIAGTGSSTFAISASNVEISGFTITRAGNTAADWNNPNLNSAGVSVQGLTLTGLLLHDNLITGMRSGIDINASNGHTIRNNVIDNNHTGTIFRNQTDNITYVENSVTNNRTVGILFLDATNGTSNTPTQQALNCTFFNNNISGNWYGQIVDRQASAFIPTPGTTNLKNFSGNWFGTNAPVVTTANSAEPAYGSLVPLGYPGGTATAPGGQPDIAGGGSANFDYSPYLNAGTDTNVQTAPGRGTYGFQGSFNELNISATSAQTGASSKIQEAIDLITAGGTLTVPTGTYPGNVNVNKALTIKGTFTTTGSFTTSASGVVLSPGYSPGIINTGDLTLTSGTTVNIEINGTTAGTQYDQFNVTGAVNLGNAALNVTLGYTPAPGHSYTIVNNDGADPVTGTFAGLANNDVFSVGPNTFRINYNGGDGNDVVVTNVSLCNTVSISTGITTPTGQVVNVPVTVDNTTGYGLYSADFTITYNSSVITTPVVTLGTVPPAGSTLTVNSATPGTLVVSVFSSSPFTGSGNLVNIAFSAIGAPATTSPVNISAFKFNEGTPCLTLNNGLVTIVSGTISGTVTYGNALVGPAPPRAVPNATLNAAGSINTSANTDVNGNYTLSGMGAGAYTVTPSKTGGVNGAVSGLDSALIAQYVVGLGSLNSTQQTVADVSGTGGITSFDAALIARYAALLPNAGSSGTWRFTPVSTPYPNVNTNYTGQNYTALLMGDVTGNWGDPASHTKGLMPSADKATGVRAAHVNASPGSEVLVPVTIGDLSGKNVLAYQFEISYDPAIIQPAQNAVETEKSMSGDMSVTVNTATPGILRVVVFGAMPMNGEGSLLHLKFIAVGDVGTSSTLSWQQFMLNEGGALLVNTADGKVDITEAVPSEGTIEGHLFTATGRGVPNTRITITATDGSSRTLISNGHGRYSFGGLRIGETYVLSADSRLYTFTPVTVSVSGSLTNVDITAEQ